MTEEGWCGRWFTPRKGKRYKIHENAGNYIDLRGQGGVCTGSAQTSFGHCWAQIAFDDGEVRQIRTCYLVDKNGEQGFLKAPPEDADRKEALRRATHVWKDVSPS